MFDQCIIALGHTVDDAVSTEWTDGMIEFLEDERNRLRTELEQLEDGTHELFAPFKAFIESDDPDAKALRESVDPRLFNPGDMSNADIATMLLDMKD